MYHITNSNKLHEIIMMMFSKHCIRNCRKVSDIRHSKSENINVSRLCLQYIEAKCWMQNENVVGAVPTGDAPTAPEWSTI